MYSQPGILQFLCQPGHTLHHHSLVVVSLVDGDHHDLDGGNHRREPQALGISVDHDDRSHHAGAHSPAGAPAVLRLVVLVEVSNVEGLGEVLAQVVRRTGLEGPLVSHHRFDGVAGQGPRELLRLRLPPQEHRNRGVAAGEIRIEIQNAQGLLLGFFVGGVNRVALLPQELHRAQEEPGPQFPPHHVGPLIDEYGQIPV